MSTTETQSPEPKHHDGCSGLNPDIVGDGNPHSFDCEGHSWTLFTYPGVLYIERAGYDSDAELTRNANGAWRFGVGATEHIAKHSTDSTPAALEAYIATRCQTAEVAEIAELPPATPLPMLERRGKTRVTFTPDERRAKARKKAKNRSKRKASQRARKGARR